MPVISALRIAPHLVPTGTIAAVVMTAGELGDGAVAHHVEPAADVLAGDGDQRRSSMARSPRPETP